MGQVEKELIEMLKKEGIRSSAFEMAHSREEACRDVSTYTSTFKAHLLKICCFYENHKKECQGWVSELWKKCWIPICDLDLKKTNHHLIKFEEMERRLFGVHKHNKNDIQSYNDASDLEDFCRAYVFPKYIDRDKMVANEVDYNKIVTNMRGFIDRLEPCYSYHNTNRQAFNGAFDWLVSQLAGKPVKLVWEYNNK